MCRAGQRNNEFRDAFFLMAIMWESAQLTRNVFELMGSDTLEGRFVVDVTINSGVKH